MTTVAKQYAVALLRRGPAWDEQKPLIEQDGVGDHLAYLGGLHEQGLLEHAGPFHQPSELVADEFVGLLVYGVDRKRAAEYAHQDPAVRSGFWCVR